MRSSPDHLVRARAADFDRRRTRVLKVLDKLAAEGQEITVSSVARAAGVRCSLIHRHGDLHAAVLARASEPPPGPANGTQVSHKSLMADVANLTARNRRLSAHERHLSESLGQTAGEASGLGAPADIETLTRRTTELEQQILDLRGELAERDEDWQPSPSPLTSRSRGHRQLHRRHPQSEPVQDGGDHRGFRPLTRPDGQPEQKYQLWLRCLVMRSCTSCTPGTR